eukprot:1160685-Pelagomonas_calceolata.AAC.1
MHRVGTPGCGSGGALCTNNWHFSHLDSKACVSSMQMLFFKYFNNFGVQHVPDACTSRSPLVNAIFEGDPAQAQTAAASVSEVCW